MSYFGNSTRLLQAQELLHNKFQATTLQELEDNRTPRRCYLSGFLLHTRKCSQTPKLTRGYSRNVASKKVASEMIAAHGFFLFGIPESQFCVCIYSKSPTETEKLLQFDDQLFPSQSVAIVQPKIEGRQSGTDNLILSSAEPIVPLDVMLSLHRSHLPPVISDSPDYRFLHFMTTSMTVDEPFAISKRCNGLLCDGSKSAIPTCLCTNQRGRSTWAITMKIWSQELCREKLDTCVAELTSVRLRSLFVNTPNEIQPGEHDWDPFEFADQITDFTSAAIGQQDQSVEILGWYKPSNIDADGIVKEPRSIHIVNIKFTCDISPVFQKLRFDQRKLLEELESENESRPPERESAPISQNDDTDDDDEELASQEDVLNEELRDFLIENGHLPDIPQ